MSVCSCPWETDDCLCSIRGPHVARSMPKKPEAAICPNCGGKVEIGQLCVDARFIWPELQSGSFARLHAECFDLMERFAERHCAGSWTLPFELDEAAEHALANGDDPYWRKWLEIYEQTWEFSPEPPDPRPVLKEAR